jgi:thiosulfate sulfurtransferase
MSGVEERDPAAVERLVGTDGSVPDLDVIDVRDRDAYESGHLPGAENVPLDDLEEVVESRDWAEEVVVVCYIGESSVQAARLIDHYSDEAVDVASMAGGYERWEGDLRRPESA